MLVKVHIVSPEFLADPAGECWGFIIDEDAPVSYARLAAGGGDGQGVEIRMVFWWDVGPPVPSW